MNVVIRLSAQGELKALPILFRHSPGMVLPERTYILSEEAVRALSEARIRFTVLCRGSEKPDLEGANRNDPI